MRLLAKAVIGLLIVVALGTALDVKASAQEAPKEGKPIVAQAKKNHRDNDGVLLATCDHPTNHVRGQAEEIDTDQRTGKAQKRVVTVIRTVSISCPPSGPTTATSGTAVMSALANWQWWICKGSTFSTRRQFLLETAPLSARTGVSFFSKLKIKKTSGQIWSKKLSFLVLVLTALIYYPLF